MSRQVAARGPMKAIEDELATGCQAIGCEPSSGCNTIEDELASSCKDWSHNLPTDIHMVPY